MHSAIWRVWSGYNKTWWGVSNSKARRWLIWTFGDWRIWILVIAGELWWLQRYDLNRITNRALKWGAMLVSQFYILLPCAVWSPFFTTVVMVVYQVFASGTSTERPARKATLENQASGLCRQLCRPSSTCEQLDTFYSDVSTVLRRSPAVADKIQFFVSCIYYISLQFGWRR